MSRSNPESGASQSPVSKYFNLSTGEEPGVTWYDKSKDETVKIGAPFKFMVLDELSTVTGWHEASGSRIWSNEVRDTRTEPFTVRAFGTGATLVAGLYAQIKEKLAALGGYYAASVYFAYLDEDAGALRIGHFKLKGAGLKAWLDFKRDCPSTDGVKNYFLEAVRLVGFATGKKGSVKFNTPVFELSHVGGAAQEQAVALDRVLQEYLQEYMEGRRASTDAAATGPAAPAQREPGEDDDIPY